jgi:hypothetical protein
VPREEEDLPRRREGREENAKKEIEPQMGHRSTHRGLASLGRNQSKKASRFEVG